MRFISASIGTTTIELTFSMWSLKESLYVNGDLVLKQWNWFCADRVFEVEEPGGLAKYRLVTRYRNRGMMIDLIRNGVVLLRSGSVGVEVRFPAIASNSSYHLEKEYV